MSVETTGFKEASRFFGNIANNITDSSHQLLLEIGDKIVDEARNNIQNNTNINSGDLLTSVKILFDDGESIYIGSDMPYAGYIEFGRGPVFPKDPNGWLHWIDKTTGKDVFAKKAGPTEPMPFLHPAAAKIAFEIPNISVEWFETNLRGMI